MMLSITATEEYNIAAFEPTRRYFARNKETPV